MDIIGGIATKLDSIKTIDELEDVRIEYLGKNGVITSEMKKLTSMSDEDKKEHGRLINNLRDHIASLISKKKEELTQEELIRKLSIETIDISLPSKSYKVGSIHPISRTISELVSIFKEIGFSIKNGPSIETDWYNFEALNIEKNHPARQMHDTFYFDNDRLLRTQTSTIQIRSMENSKPPLRFVSPGRTYRCDSDATHSPMFHQMEALWVDENVHLGHLKYLVIDFIKKYFNDPNIEFRFRPSFFPFTEPSFEVDIKMPGINKWLEVLGCGLIHPHVLQNVNIDAEKYSGLALGVGIERFAMLKYGIRDLRQFFENDMRWIKHYSFSAFDINNLYS
jgi:phenylalanyl-tRNA synthetase alpha chain